MVTYRISDVFTQWGKNYKYYGSFKMILKHNIEIDNKIIVNRLQNLINQTYKLLPIREEGIDWIKPL